jgi:hypothetical protein
MFSELNNENLSSAKVQKNALVVIKHFKLLMG